MLGLLVQASLRASSTQGGDQGGMVQETVALGLEVCSPASLLTAHDRGSASKLKQP